MNMSGAKMSARRPTRFHDAGSTTRPGARLRRGRPPVRLLALIGGLVDLDLTPFLVHVHELVLVTTFLLRDGAAACGRACDLA